jgi:hypothetical protein
LTEEQCYNIWCSTDSEMIDDEQRHTLTSATAGLQWKSVGSETPTRGSEITNASLAAALQKKIKFSQKELENFNIDSLSYDSYIKVENTYFVPTISIAEDAVTLGLPHIVTKVQLKIRSLSLYVCKCMYTRICLCVLICIMC